MYCSKCGQANDDHAVYCVVCGGDLHSIRRPQYVPAQKNFADTLIPSKNTQALIAYYLGVFSLVIWILGVPAFILGLKGLMRAKVDPNAKGKIHAWVGIVLGIISTLILLFILGTLIAAFVLHW